MEGGLASGGLYQYKESNTPSHINLSSHIISSLISFTFLFILEAMELLSHYSSTRA